MANRGWLVLALLAGCSCPPGEGSDTDTQSPVAGDCAAYCEAVQDACGDKGRNTSQYDDYAACLARCSEWAPIPGGSIGETGKNTTGCRHHYAKLILAAVDDAQREARACEHCITAGPSGGGVCGTWCDNYCHLAAHNCDVDAAECEASCGPLFCGGRYDATELDSIQCRTNHAALAGLEPDAGHCAAEQCVGEKEGDTCENPFEIKALPFKASTGGGGFRDAATWCSGGEKRSDIVFSYTPSDIGIFSVTSPNGHSAYIATGCAADEEGCLAWAQAEQGGVKVQANLESNVEYFFVLELGPDGCGTQQLSCGGGDPPWEITVDVECHHECPVDNDVSCEGETFVATCGHFDSDECLDRKVDECPFGTVCQQGECVDQCDNECTPGGPPDCVGDYFFTTCVETTDFCFQLLELQCPKDFVCVDGACQPGCVNDCEPGGPPECLEINSYLECVDYDGDGCYGIVEGFCEGTQMCIGGFCQDDGAICQKTPAGVGTDTKDEAIFLGIIDGDALTEGVGGVSTNLPKWDLSDWWYVDVTSIGWAADTPLVGYDGPGPVELTVELQCTTGAAKLTEGASCTEVDDLVRCTASGAGAFWIAMAATCPEGDGSGKLYARVTWTPDVAAECPVEYSLTFLP